MMRETDGQGTSGAGMLASPPRFDTVITIFLALAGWRAGIAQISDNSFLCHLRTGQWILDHGVPHADIFSFTAAGTPWVAESWLADLLYGVLNRWFGPAGVTTANAAVAAAIAALWYRLALRLSRDRVRAFLITLFSLGASFTLWSPRPLLFGILAFLILVWIVETPDSAVGRRPLFAIPPLIWVWANVHGTIMLAFVYIGLHCLGRWLDGARPWSGRERQLVEATVAAVVLCFANPYGGQLLAAPLHLLAHHGALSHVTEWRPPRVRSVQGVAYMLWVLTFIGAAVGGGFRRIKLRGLAVSVPFLVLGFWAERNIAIAPIASFPVAARALAATQERAAMRVALNWVMVVLGLALGVWWTMRAWARPALDFRRYPVAAMEAVESQGLLGRRLLTTDAWGDYIILRYGPRQRVFMDDRYDVYPASVTTDMTSLLNGHGDWLRIIQRYNIEVVVWPSAYPSLKVLAKAPGFQRLYEDRIAVVLIR